MKELLVEDECHPTDLLNLCLRRCVPVDEVSSDGNSKLAPELLTPKPWGELQEDEEVEKKGQESVRAVLNCDTINPKGARPQITKQGFFTT